MKNLILIIGLILFLGCEKEKVQPTQELISIELSAFSLESEPIIVSCAIVGKEVNLSFNVNCILDKRTGATIAKKDFYITKGETIKLIVNHNDMPNSTLAFYAYTNPKMRAFSFIKQNEYLITLKDQVNDNIKIE